MQFFRITEPMFIPRHLLEQIKDRNWEVDDFYGQLNLATGRRNKISNPNCYLYVLLDKPGSICGFLWLMYTPYNKTLWVNNYSVDKTHWNKGICLPLAFEKVREVMYLKGADEVNWITQTAKPFEAFGFVASQKKLMTYSPKLEPLHDAKLSSIDQHKEIETWDQAPLQASSTAPMKPELPEQHRS